MMRNVHPKLKLEFNPFEPSAAGAPLKSELVPPEDLQGQVQKLLVAHEAGIGVKAIVILGEYGTGKTCLLKWLDSNVLPERRIRSFYFDNPGVHFYSLANTLLRTIGRKDFAKFIWELVGPHVTGYQQSLFRQSYEEYLFGQHGHRVQDATASVQEAILQARISADEEIANCLARIVTETAKKPYFEYRDFLPRQSGTVVAESEEAPYFRALLKVIARGVNAQGVGFLIDEFEEVGLQKRLTRREAHAYLGTLKRLLNFAQSDDDDDIDFWIVLSMTPDIYETTCKLDPALGQRFTGRVITIAPLRVPDASALIESRLRSGRHSRHGTPPARLFPFPEEIGFKRQTWSNPRRLIKSCFYAIADVNDDTAVPFTREYLEDVEERVYRSADSKEGTS